MHAVTGSLQPSFSFFTFDTAMPTSVNNNGFFKNHRLNPQYKRKKAKPLPKDHLQKICTNARQRIDAEIKELNTRIFIECFNRNSTNQPSLPEANKPLDTKETNENTPALTSCLFTDLPLSQRMLKGLTSGSFHYMTPIQQKAIPCGLAGCDILGEAPTGSGKTLAFLIPLLENLYRQKWDNTQGLGALVITPTRELAAQTFDVLRHIGRFHEFSAICLIGGKNVKHEADRIGAMNIVVATPGRLLQHLDETPDCDVSNLNILIVDEADILVDLGFSETMTHIVAQLPKSSERQTLMFSATLGAAVQRLALISLKPAEQVIRLRVVESTQSHNAPTPSRLQQAYIRVILSDQVELLFSFLRSQSQKRTIVFVNSCKQVRFLYEAFRILKPGCAMFELHGRQNQQKRLDVFHQFGAKKAAACLLCTDVAARGIDFPAVDWVVQLNCPPDVATYVHRVGRTARYQSSGRSVLFLLPSEAVFLKRLKEQKIEPTVMYIQPKKIVPIRQRLAALVASNQQLKHLAQRAYVSYIRSVQLTKDTALFQADQMLRDAGGASVFAESLGLAGIPPGAPVETSIPEKRAKLTKLQRLKNKIQKKKETATPEYVKENLTTQDNSADDWGSDASIADKAGTSAHLSKNERRLRRLRALRETHTDIVSHIVAEDDPSDVLIPQPNRSEFRDDAPIASLSLHDPTVKKKLREDRIKIRADGTTKIKGLAAFNSEIHGTQRHIFFDNADETEKTLFQHVIADLNASSEPLTQEAPTSHLTGDKAREAHLEALRKKLRDTTEIDRARDRERIRQRHAKKKEKERTSRRLEQTSENPVHVFFDPSTNTKSTILSSDDSPINNGECSPQTLPRKRSERIGSETPSPKRARPAQSMPLSATNESLASLESAAMQALLHVAS